jgi:flagellar basal-body rod modification protein FlgD
MATVNTNTSNAVDPSLLNTMNGTNSKTRTTTEETQDRFMKLLVTQMKNQDPLNPMDNAQVTSQMAQLSTVTGIEKLNTAMAGISATFSSTQSMQAASMIGRGVVVPGNGVELKDGKSVLGFELPQSADKVSVQIKSASGTVVRTMSVDAKDMGMNSVTWDGKDDTGKTMTNGNYTFEVQANAGDKKLTVQPLAFGMVSSIAFTPQGPKVSLTNFGEFDLSSVRQMF